MTRFALSLVAALAASPALAAPPALADGRAADRAAISAYEHSWTKCFVTGDPAPMQRLIAADFAGISPQGASYGKEGALADIRASHPDTLSAEITALNIRFYGDVAVALGKQHAVSRSSGPNGTDLIWTDIWVKHAGAWQLEAAQDTPMQGHAAP